MAKDERLLPQELPEKADHKVIDKIGLFKAAPTALVEALSNMASVLFVPRHVAVVYQGTIGDAMYYVVEGSLLRRFVQVSVF